MAAPEGLSLCVSIHDVAPATWPDCLRLWQAVRAVADIPVTWLVVPHYHARRAGRDASHFESALDGLLATGHELALHGYTHLDRGPLAQGPGQAWLRQVYTRREGEFAALGEAAAARRLALGQAWFALRGWPLHGFVAPAWLLSDGTWAALRASSLRYTTTLAHFHWLRAPGGALRAPALVYAARNWPGRILSKWAVAALAASQARAPLVRLCLHPRDAHHPALLAHLQVMLDHMLQVRLARTKYVFAMLPDCNG